MDIIEDEFTYEGDNFWWPRCPINGCTNYSYRKVWGGKCHPHTFTNPWHKLQRFFREIFA